MHNKGNHKQNTAFAQGNHKQNKKTTLRIGENICKQSNQQGINLQNIQTSHAPQYQEKQTT